MGDDHARYAGARWDDAEEAGHTESWFVKANDPEGHRAIWLKWTLFRGIAKGGAPKALAESWAVAFRRGGEHVAVKASVPVASASFAKHEMDVHIEGSRLTGESARGAVASGGRAVEFDLTIDRHGAPFVAYIESWMAGRFPSQKLCSPIVHAALTGTVRVEGESWPISSWPGMVGHNWGRQHTPFYAWMHCNAWERIEGASSLVVECAGGKPKVGPVSIPLSAIAWARVDGEEIALNSPLAILRNKVTASNHAFTVRGAGASGRLSVDVRAEPGDTVGLSYPNPHGPITHCLNTKLARAEVTLTTKSGRNVHAVSRAAALEIGTLDPSHGVRMYL